MAVSFRVYRVLKAPLEINLMFNRRGWQDKRPELDSYQHNADFRERGYLEFKQPGEPITVRVTSTAGLDREFDALPVNSHNGTTMGRALVSTENYNSTHRLVWPPESVAVPGGALPSGVSDLTISVVDVGQTLVGENITVIVGAPVKLKRVAPGYDWLWWLHFWPVFATLLAIYCCVLCWRSYLAARK